MKTTQKYIRTSPQKLRLIADAVRDMSPEQALIYLKFLRKKAALPLSKAIKTALASAKQAGRESDALRFKTIDIKKGPLYKRWRAVSRGAAHGIVKQTSHIFIVLEEKNGAKS